MLLQGESYDSSGFLILIVAIAAIIGCNYAIYRIENKILRWICVAMKCFAEGLGLALGVLWIAVYGEPFAQQLGQAFFWNIYRPIFQGSDSQIMLLIVITWLLSIPFTFFSIRRKKHWRKSQYWLSESGKSFPARSSDAFWQPYLESTARCFARYPLIFIKRCAILSPVAAHKNKVVQGLQGGHRL